MMLWELWHLNFSLFAGFRVRECVQLKYPNIHTGFVHWLPGGGEEHRAVSPPASQSH